MKTLWIVTAAALLVSISCRERAKVDTSAVDAAVRAVLAAQARDWNNGDVAAYMTGYESSDALRFASGASVTYGWQATLERYQKRYPDQRAMGTLTFSDIDVEVLSADAALVFGRFKLQRLKDEPTGLFSLVFRKTSAGWRITHDHTSSACD